MNVPPIGASYFDGGHCSQFYYVIPEPLMDGLVLALEEDLALTFEHDDMRVTESSAFCPPSNSL